VVQLDEDDADDDAAAAAAQSARATPVVRDMTTTKSARARKRTERMLCVCREG
jgi:hypothetical protein